jgi:hypothetical protein
MDALFDLSHSLSSEETLESRSTEPEMTLRHLEIQIFDQLRAKVISSSKETQLPAPVAILLPVEQSIGHLRLQQHSPSRVHHYASINPQIHGFSQCHSNASSRPLFGI